MLKLQKNGTKFKNQNLIRIMKDCTIIIPTYNRNEYLKILLNYLIFSNINCPIIIADGSNSSNEIEKNIKIISKFKKNLDINHFINDSFFVKRLYLASDLVTTKYCKINTDDDFFSPDFINLAIEELSITNDFAAITGYNVSFHRNNNNPNNSKVFLGEKHSAYQDNIVERFRNAKFNWQPWAVYKSENMKQILKITNDITKSAEVNNNFDEAKQFRFFSFVMKLKSLIDGKYKYINKCMNITVYHDENWGKKHKIDTFNFFFDKEFLTWMIDLKNKFNYEKNFDDLIKLTLINDKHFYSKKKKEKNLIQKISNISISKLSKLIIKKFEFFRNNEFFLEEDAKKIIKFLRKNI